MTEAVRVVPIEQLREIIDRFAEIEWPAEPEVALALAADLGWQTGPVGQHGVDFTTGLAVNDDDGDALFLSRKGTTPLSSGRSRSGSATRSTGRTRPSSPGSRPPSGRRSRT